ncbi:MAG: histidinol-phosphate transaminase, partial [Bryobacteraceae bacterium]
MPLVPPYVESLRPYVAGRNAEQVRREYGLDRVVKLASNENPLGPSPRAVEAMRGALGELHLYPTGGLELRKVLAKQYDL